MSIISLLGCTDLLDHLIVTSRSLDRQTTDNRLLSKREVKISAVERAISVLLTVGIADNKERKERDSAKLAEFLD